MLLNNNDIKKNIKKINPNLKDINNYILSNLKEENNKILYYELLDDLKNDTLINIDEKYFKDLLIKNNLNDENKNIIKKILNNYFVEKNNSDKKNNFYNEEILENKKIKKIENNNINKIDIKKIENKRIENISQKTNIINMNKDKVFDNKIINNILDKKKLNKENINLLQEGTYLFIKNVLNDLTLTSDTIKNEYKNEEKQLIFAKSKNNKSSSNFKMVTTYDPVREFKINEMIENKISKFYENKLKTTKENKNIIKKNKSSKKSNDYMIDKYEKKKKINFDEDYEICKIINKLKADKMKISEKFNLNQNEKNNYIDMFMNNKFTYNNENEINLHKRETNNIENNNFLIGIKELIFYLQNSSKYKKSKYYYKALLQNTY